MTPKPEHSPLSACTGWEKACCFFLLAGSLIYYWLVFFHHALDAGQADDFVDALWFFEIFRAQENWLDQLAVIALPNHEHITIFNHLVYLADYALFGKINFFHYMFVGHLIILACCFLLAEWLQKTVGWWYALALAFGIFLNLFYWHASFWAITALSNQAVILFALLAARSCLHEPSAVTVPAAWALLAAITQFNGMFVLVALAGASLMSARSEGHRQNWRQILLWSAMFIVVAVIYMSYENPLSKDHLWRYVALTDPGKIAEYVKPTGEGRPESPFYLSYVPLTLATVIGATVFNLDAWLPATVLGFGLIIVLCMSGLKAPTRTDRFWWAMLLFTLGSVLLIALGRGWIFGPSAGLLYRYRLYSFIALLLVVYVAINGKHQRIGLYGAMAMGFFIQLCSVHVLDDINDERNSIKQSHYNWLVDGGMGRSSMPSYPHNQDWRLFNAYENGYYNPYRAVDKSYQPVRIERVGNDACQNTVFYQQSDVPAVKAWSKKARALSVEISLDLPAAKAPLQLLFCDNANGYLVELGEQNINPLTGKYWPVLVLKKDLPASQYRVSLMKDGVSSAGLGQIIFP